MSPLAEDEEEPLPQLSRLATNAATASVPSPLMLPTSASSRITDAGPHGTDHINCVTVKL